jgi:hypothetical protein
MKRFSLACPSDQFPVRGPGLGSLLGCGSFAVDLNRSIPHPAHRRNQVLVLRQIWVPGQPAI